MTLSEAKYRIEKIKDDMYWIWREWRRTDHRKNYKEYAAYKRLMEEWQDINRTYLTTERARDVRFDCPIVRG